MVRQTAAPLALVSLALLIFVLLVDPANGNTELNHNTSRTHATQTLSGRVTWHQRRDEFFNNTVFSTYPDCSMNCLEDNVRDTTCAALNGTPKLYSDCVCRRSDTFQIAAAACIGDRCLNELRSSARKFSDECTSSGGSTVKYDTWLAQENVTSGTAQPTNTLSSTLKTTAMSSTTSTQPPSTTTASPIVTNSSSNADNKIGWIVAIIVGIPTIVATFFAWRMWTMAREQRRIRDPESQHWFLRPIDLFARRLLACANRRRH